MRFFLASTGHHFEALATSHLFARCMSCDRTEDAEGFAFKTDDTAIRCIVCTLFDPHMCVSFIAAAIQNVNTGFDTSFAYWIRYLHIGFLYSTMLLTFACLVLVLVSPTTKQFCIAEAFSPHTSCDL